MGVGSMALTPIPTPSPTPVSIPSPVSSPSVGSGEMSSAAWTALFDSFQFASKDFERVFVEARGKGRDKDKDKDKDKCHDNLREGRVRSRLVFGK
jgi:hypothetical protein